MKFIKLSIAILLVGSLSSCLKSKNDFAGLRTDPGKVLVSISEAQYLNADGYNLGFGWDVYANFSLSTANEAVRFFSLHVSQPRDTKMSGPLTVKVTMSAYQGAVSGIVAPPAGAITVSDIVIPKSDAESFDVPVKFTVNKSLLNASNHYGARFTITSVSEGAYSENEKTIDVAFNDDPFYNTSKWSGVYNAVTTVKDSANFFGINNNTRAFFLSEGINWWTYGTATNVLFPIDTWIAGFNSSTAQYIYANNLTTGANTAIISVGYKLDATGKVIDVVNAQNPTQSLNPVFDTSVPNSIVYTSNDERVLSVKYTIRLSLPSAVGTLTRPFTITDTYTYHKYQVFYPL